MQIPSHLLENVVLSVPVLVYTCTCMVIEWLYVYTCHFMSIEILSYMFMHVKPIYMYVFRFTENGIM